MLRCFDSVIFLYLSARQMYPGTPSFSCDDPPLHSLEISIMASLIRSIHEIMHMPFVGR